MDGKKILRITAGIAALVLALLLGPVNFFWHGFFCERMESLKTTEMLERYLCGTIDLSKEGYYGTILPTQSHFAGLQLCLNLPANSVGGGYYMLTSWTSREM